MTLLLLTMFVYAINILFPCIEKNTAIKAFENAYMKLSE